MPALTAMPLGGCPAPAWRVWQAWWAWLLVMVVAMLAGCGSTGHQAAPAVEPLPKLSDLARPDADQTNWIRDSGMSAVARVTRLWLPMDHPDDAWWADGALPVLSEPELEAWRQNGLRAMVIGREALEDQLRRLPGHLGVSHQWLTLSGELTPLDPASGVSAAQPTLVLVDGEAQLHRGGRMQWLVATDLMTGPAIKLTFVPHHHIPQAHLLPRSHLAAALDGQMFIRLMLRVQLAPGQVLLLSPVVTPASTMAAPALQQEPDVPPSMAHPASQDAPSAARTTSPPGPPTAGQVAPPRPPLASQSLGQALLAGSQVRTELHQLLLIEVAQLPRPAGTPEPTPAGRPTR